jgi:hypothetical protein
MNRVIDIFRSICEKNGDTITRDLFRKNLELKRMEESFQLDMRALLPKDLSWNFEEAFGYVQEMIISKI